MLLNLRFSIMRLVCMLILLAAFMPIIFASGTETVPISDLPTWIKEHFALVAFFVSEGMSFLPSKASGIIKGIFSIFQLWIKKKPTYTSKLRLL